MVTVTKTLSHRDTRGRNNMIEATAKYNLQNMLITENDYFKETAALTSHKYLIDIVGITKEESDFLEETMRTNKVVHQYIGDGHRIIVSAQGMINFGRAVFCPQDENIVELIQKVVAAVCEVDKGLVPHLVSDCVYRNGICTRDEPCGRSIDVLKQLISVVPEKYYRDARNKKLTDDVIKDREGKGGVIV